MFFGKKYKVSMNGRAGISYKENGFVVHIDSEMLDGPNFDLVIYLENVSNWKTEGSVLLDAEKIEAIKSRVRYEFRKVRVEWS